MHNNTNTVLRDFTESFRKLTLSVPMRISKSAPLQAFVELERVRDLCLKSENHNVEYVTLLHMNVPSANLHHSALHYITCRTMTTRYSKLRYNALQCKEARHNVQ